MKLQNISVYQFGLINVRIWLINVAQPKITLKIATNLLK